jgi:hypothetical protein
MFFDAGENRANVGSGAADGAGYDAGWSDIALPVRGEIVRRKDQTAQLSIHTEGMVATDGAGSSSGNDMRMPRTYAQPVTDIIAAAAGEQIIDLLKTDAIGFSRGAAAEPEGA